MNARLAWLVLLGALVGSACSFLVNFDPEGQPCDQQGACLEGYGCVDGKCQKGAQPIDCKQCPAGDCLPGTNECLPNTCQYKICQPAYYCDEAGGAPPTCKLVPPNRLGAQCVDDSFCTGPNDVCMFGAIQSNTNGGLRSGICVEKCGPLDSCPAGNECRTFSLGLDSGTTRVCLPQNSVTACTSDDACRRANLVCTVFDHPDIGTLTACDSPISAAASAGVGEPCVRERDPDGGTGEFCGNGLCIPQLPAGSTRSATCGQLCDQTGCPQGSTCEMVQFSVRPEAARYLPMCVPAKTRCVSCSADPTLCGPDAPWCTTLNADPRCLGACTPDAGSTGATCPPDYACSQVGMDWRCVPTLGFCP